MIVRNHVKRNAYYDSLTLMVISNQMAEEIGTENVAVMMGTDANKDILRASGLLTEEGDAAGASDLIFAVKGNAADTITKTFEKAEHYLKNRSSRLTANQENIVKTFDSALQKVPDLNFAVISVPGKYAKREALKAINAGMHVLLFSDNVSLEDEIELKDQALARGLLMMGPDCGTAIINGVALGFANVVERGDIGIVAAAGTGLQEVSTIISKNGGGISQAIGTGGRDVKDAVGGKMMLAGMEALMQDPQTAVILLISKPPAQTVLEKIARNASETKKPVVTCFLGGRIDLLTSENCFPSQTLETAAKTAIRLSHGEVPPSQVSFALSEKERHAIIVAESTHFEPSQQYIRGLYTGGTLCYEAMLIADEYFRDIYSNIPLYPRQALQDHAKSQGHTFLDLGEDEFTQGRPHPMIEPGLRNDRILRESRDAEVAVLLLDVVLGYGAHDDPAEVVAVAITQAKDIARKAGRYLAVVVSVCGTSQDPQNLAKQSETLQQAGAVVMPNNAQAVKMAALIASRGKVQIM